MLVRRVNRTPRRASNSATAAKRSRCRGTNSSRRSVGRSAVAACASSSLLLLACVGAAGDPDGAFRRRTKREARLLDEGAGINSKSNLILPTTWSWSCAPMALKRSASGRICAAINGLRRISPGNRRRSAGSAQPILPTAGRSRATRERRGIRTRATDSATARFP